MTDRLEALLALRARPFRRIVGLNSGTSADGIDAAVVRVHGAGAATRVELEAFIVHPWPAELAARLAAPADAAAIAVLDFEIGAAFAAAARAALDAAGQATADLVGSHGQTVAHLPRSAGLPGATLQLGQAAVIGEELGVPVVSDFRARDVAAGGEGAPLVPLADQILFHRPGRTRALQNIGGIANVTIVGDDLLAFDTGPGNMPLDEAARRVLGRPCDAAGAHAARGTVDAAVVRELLQHPFFALPPPRSTGRERFGAHFVAPLLARFAGRPDDLLATLTRFVAESIHAAYVGHVLGRFVLTDVLVSGGGVHNSTLMRHLAELFAPTPVGSTAAEGVDPDAKEAMAFAILANETLFAHAGNVPAATGARGPRVLGAIAL
jgi:anhydro-N-acetylmuramic acid kinase